MFGGLKDWRSVAKRYARCLKTRLFAMGLAAIVFCWLSIPARDAEGYLEPFSSACDCEKKGVKRELPGSNNFKAMVSVCSVILGDCLK